jgi:hypothetical protein
MATRDRASTSHILPQEREKASFNVDVLKDIVAGKREYASLVWVWVYGCGCG